MSTLVASRPRPTAAADPDALPLVEPGERVSRRSARFLRGFWPPALALVLALLAWQAVVWSGWRPNYLLPGPGAVGRALVDQITTGDFWSAVATTMRRALLGFALAVLVGTVIGTLVARIRPLHSAVGALVTGLQSMPSIAWFPLAILLFGLNESAILFVVILGAAPSVATGLLGGIDYVPPLLVQAGRQMGASGWRLYRHVILPAALPAFVGGLRQGWAFSWRSLMAGELLVVVPGTHSIGATMEYDRQFSDTTGLLASMVVVLVIGLVVDWVFRRVDRRLRARRGLLATT